MRYAIAVSFLLITGCHGSDSTNSDIPLGDNSLQTVVSAIKVGSPPGTYANDLDGDGHPDDKLGSVAADLASGGGVNVQADIDAAITAGGALLLIEIRSNDTAFASDDAAAVILSKAMAVTPEFSGHGTFIVDTNIPSVTLAGKIDGGIFTSTPQTGKPDPLTLPLPTGDGLVAVQVIDVQVRAAIDAQAHTLSNGRLTGAIPGTDISTKVIPTVTAGMSPIVAAVVAGAFASDVALLDGDGKLAPSATRTPKDSFSLGLGISAVGAAY